MKGAGEKRGKVCRRDRRVRRKAGNVDCRGWKGRELSWKGREYMG